MVSLTTLATGIIGAVFIIGLFAWMGYDIEATLKFLKGNWSTVILAIQIIVVYVLASTGHKVAGAIVLATALVTVMGKVISLD